MSTGPPYLHRLITRREHLGWRWGRYLFSVKLVERSVQLELKRQEDLEKLYHKKADFLYEEYDVSERQQEFEKLDWSLFRRSKLPERIATEVEKFPMMKDRVGNIVVSAVDLKSEESADLLVKDDGREILISIHPETLVNWNSGRTTVLHELMHVADMLDPSFLYEKRKLGASPAEEEIVRQRFSLLWRISIDGRLERKGEAPSRNFRAYEPEFNRLFRRIPIGQHERILEKLWSGNSLTYRDLIGFAFDLSKLMEWAGIPVELIRDEGAGLVMSSFCPLCRCRMYQAVRLDEQSDRARVDRIRKEFPVWSPDQGICERCLEYCELSMIA